MHEAKSNYVLTYNPKDERLQEVITLIREHNLPVYLSQVSGFGMPELRIGLSNYVRGVGNITGFLQISLMAPTDIRTLRKTYKRRIAQCKQRLKEAEEELERLQRGCSHPNEQSRPDYDFTAHWCNDCKAWWSTRR